MPLQSKLFKDSIRLQKCSMQDSAHVTLNDIGDHVGRIQAALSQLDSSKIDSLEAARKIYGSSTAKAVLNYKTARKIINHSYQSKADAIVGKMTITTMDNELIEAVRPALGRLTTKFLPTFRQKIVGYSRVASSDEPFAPIGPVVRRNGYDPNPDDVHLPGFSWQMVPVDGERHLFLSAPPGLRFRFALDVITGSDPTQTVFVEEVVPSSVGGLQEVRLVGKKQGWAQLTAYNVSDGKPSAQLSINVLDQKIVKFGFAALKDRTHTAKNQNSAAEAYLENFNKIWSSQANISGIIAGRTIVSISDELGDEPSEKALIAIGPKIRDIAIKQIGPCDRVVTTIWGMVRPSLIGLGVDVIYLRDTAKPTWSTFSHEFGHTLGLKHEMAGTDALNLMYQFEDRSTIQISLNRKEIMKANEHPGTWQEVRTP